MRGKRSEIPSKNFLSGSIPACAGETPTADALRSLPTVYPRVCGGNECVEPPVQPAQGLSPRVRGKPRPGGSDTRHRGSIPACAGETQTVGRLPLEGRVYPRVCGGNNAEVDQAVLNHGLSPRVRGKHSLRSHAPSYPGSIPACAGETAWAGRSKRSSRVYPRVCGGNAVGENKRQVAEGLSPRVRGKPSTDAVILGRAGSIPACAGETEIRHGHVLCQRVYPRVCGGNSSGFPGPAGGVGLSPRVRGKRVHTPAGRRANRSIPACAGETFLRQAVFHRPGVYPRVCGGNVRQWALGRCCRGLSPRVRGKRRYRDVPAALLGSIPACAGETPERN